MTATPAEPRSEHLLIRTPEGVVFSQPLAGPASRFLAWVLDLCVIAAMTLLATKSISLLGMLGTDVVRGGGAIAYFVCSIGYGIATEWYWRGQTLGKRVLQLRVIDRQGLRLQPSQIVLRNLLRAVDVLPVCYLVGGIASMVSRHGQRLGDLAANTVVVRHARVTQPDLDQLLGGKFNSFLAYRHLAARLRQRTSAELADVALQALVRRDEFRPDARLVLFGELAAALRSLVEFPAEVTEFLTDEQYVRNAVEILFRTQSDRELARPAAGQRTAL